jgi:molybdopterin converting factor small subunit
MKITFKLYASARDVIGESKVEIEVDGGINILYAFVHVLHKKYPQYDFSVCRFGRGTRYIDLTTPLFEGDLISVIPPVSGG